MRLLVIDASAVCELLLQRAHSRRVEKLVAECALYAPGLLTVEVMSVLRRWQRTDQITRHRAQEALTDLLDLPISLVDMAPLARTAWKVADSVSAYDAMYVALAQSLDCQLLTFDRRLATAIGDIAA